MSSLRLLAILPLFALACGGSSTTSSPPSGAPLAQAGPDQAVASGALVTLDGTGSSDPAGRPLVYLWSQTSGPTVALSGASVAAPTFSAPAMAAGQPALTLVFMLRATSAGGTSTASVTVTVNAPQPANPPPVASAGPNQSVASGAAVVALDGSASKDPDGEVIAYSWTQAPGTAVTLAGASTAHPTFAAPAVASGSPPVSLAFSLVVTDAHASSAPSSVTVVVHPAGGATCAGGVPPPPPGTPPPSTDPNPPPAGGNGSRRFQIGTDLGTGGLTIVEPAAGEPTVEGFVLVSLGSGGGPAPADAVVTVNGAPLERFPGSGVYWTLDPATTPQPRVASGGELVVVATATDPLDGKKIQRTLVLQCPSDIPVTITPAPGSPLGAGSSLNLKSSSEVLNNQGVPLFAPYGPKITVRGFDPCTRALGDGVSLGQIVTANGFDVNVPILATSSGAYLVDLRWPGPGILDGESGGYCQLAKRFFFPKH